MTLWIIKSFEHQPYAQLNADSELLRFIIDKTTGKVHKVMKTGGKLMQIPNPYPVFEHYALKII